MKRTLIFVAPAVALIALGGYTFGVLTHGANSGVMAAQVAAQGNTTAHGSTMAQTTNTSNGGVQMKVGQPAPVVQQPVQPSTTTMNSTPSSQPTNDPNAQVNAALAQLGNSVQQLSGEDLNLLQGDASESQDGDGQDNGHGHGHGHGHGNGHGPKHHEQDNQDNQDNQDD